MAETLTTLSICIIRPSSPTPPQHMFLSAQDFIWRWFHYNRRILFFKLHDQALPSSDSFVALLKSSLALALVEFFPWAGRIFEQENGRLSLDCNDAGVPFIEAYFDLPFSSLENDGLKYQPFFKDFAPHGDVTRWTGPDLPLLSVQVTRFPRDEGFALGIGNSHIVADGTSLWHFMKSWGECARGVPLSLHPVHMREELGPEKLILPPPCPEAENDKSWPGFPESETALAQRDFLFTSEMVRKIKQMATASAPAGHAPFSSLQALSAHIWRHVIAATDMDKGKKSIFFMLANMRSRVQPPLPEGYFGNALSREGTIASKEELEEESLGATAVRLQELSRRVTDEKLMRGFYGKVEVLPFWKLHEGDDFSMPMLQVSGSPRFPVNDVDFGWGPPLRLQSPRLCNGEMVWYPGPEGGGSIHVFVALPTPVMDRLVRDDSLLFF